MRNYRRLMLGAKSSSAARCFEGNFVGTDFNIGQDLTGKLPDNWRAFNKVFVPIYMERNPAKTKIGAGLACGQLWTISRGMSVGDIVLCPDGSGRYHVCEVTGHYEYRPNEPLPHTRPVRWLTETIDRTDMSEALRQSCGSPGTVVYLTPYAAEIEQLLGGVVAPTIITKDESVEDPSEFAMEKHLEDFLVKNCVHTDLGKDYDIYQEDGESVGQQYPTDTGPLDILAVSKDKKSLLVVELKKGKASDVVVGQTLRYMGFVNEELAEEGQEVKGIIIALDDDKRIQRALSLVPTISFYRYQVSFKLIKTKAGQ